MAPTLTGKGVEDGVNAIYVHAGGAGRSSVEIRAKDYTWSSQRAFQVVSSNAG
jgi:hypothetical protein